MVKNKSTRRKLERQRGATAAPTSAGPTAFSLCDYDQLYIEFVVKQATAFVFDFTRQQYDAPEVHFEVVGPMELFLHHKGVHAPAVVGAKKHKERIKIGESGDVIFTGRRGVKLFALSWQISEDGIEGQFNIIGSMGHSQHTLLFEV